MKNKINSLLPAAVLLFLTSTGSSGTDSGTGTVITSLRPTYVYLESGAAPGAVLVTLSGYSGNDVRYRLFNGSSQYACWNSATNAYITSASYASGPSAPGRPSGSSAFWIVYQRGTNNSASASYRDRVGPEYASNNKTVALPAAIEITDSFVVSGSLIGTEVNKLDQKYVVLGWKDDSLICATSSALYSGEFELFSPVGKMLDKIEIRTLDNLSLGIVKGNWSGSCLLSELNLIDNPVQDAKLCAISINGINLQGFGPEIFYYNIELPSEEDSIPVVEFTTQNSDASAFVKMAKSLSGNTEDRITSIIVTSADGKSSRTYTILFNPLLKVSTIAEFRSGDTSHIYLITGEAVITFVNSYRSQKYIQDSSAAVLIDDPQGIITCLYSTGDRITNLKGIRKCVNGSTFFSPISDPGAPLFKGSEAIPEILTIERIYEDFESYDCKLAKLFGMKLLDKEAIITANTVYTITDGVNTAELYVKYENLDYVGQSFSGICDISGLISINNGIIRITPRSSDDIYEYHSDATLTGITINGNPYPDFDPLVLEYLVRLPQGTNDVPVLDYSTSDPLATAAHSVVTNLSGSEEERTFSIIVTAEDGLNQLKYSITFILDNENGIPGISQSGITVTPVPVQNDITIRGLAPNTLIKIHDITGNTVLIEETPGEELKLDLTFLTPGMYILCNSNRNFRFIKQ